MRQTAALRITPPAVVLLFALGTLAESARGAEPVDEFLKALRTAGYHDTAGEYLQRVVESPSVDDEFRQRYGYELGSALIDAAKTTPDPVLRDRLWDQGLGKLKDFVAANGQHPLAAAANWKRAETLVVRGRALTSRAARSRDKDKLREQARAMFAESVEVYEAIEKQHVSEFEKQAANADRERRNQLGVPILEARLRIGEVLTEVAGTHEVGSDSANAALQQAIDRFKQLYSKYSDEGFVAAYIARVREAENYFQMGKTDEAIARLGDVLELDSGNQDLRDRVLTPAYLLALQAWHKKGDFNTAVGKGERYAGNPRAQEVNRPDWLQMQYLLAVAYQQQAEQAKPGDANKAKLETEARKLAAEVIKHKSEVQSGARELLGKLGRPVEEANGEAKTFAEAFEKATAAVQAYTAAKTALESAAADSASIAELEKTAAETRAAAESAARRSLLLADGSADLSQVNTARFYLAYLHWEIGLVESAEDKPSSHYFDAAVLSEFIARRFPEHANARQAMSIALASYQRIRQDISQEVQRAAEKEGKSAEEARTAAELAVSAWSDKISELAQYAVAKWPETDESAGAIAVLASLAIERNEFDAAIQHVEKLKAGTKRRAETELRIGRAIWASYSRAKKELDLRAKAQADGSGETPNAKGAASDTAVAGNPRGPDNSTDVTHQTLADSAKKAQALLEAGLASAKASGEIDRSVVLGLWALVQSYLATSQADKAIPLLEEEKLGLLTLVNNKHEAAEIEGLMFDAYRLALRAYIAVKPQQLEKAISTMDALEKITGSDAKGREQLTSIYIAMGRDLQKEIESLAAAGNTSEVQSLSAAFEAFLNRLVSRESGNNFNSLFWIGDTYTQLGAGLAGSAKTSAADRQRAENYFKKAVAAFEKILESEKTTAGFMPEKYRPVVEMRLAKALRGAGEHNKALKSLVAVLKAKPNVLDAQFEAAYTYQEFADSDRAKWGKYFLHAIRGGQSEDYRNIWGWNSLAERIRTQEHRLRSEPDDPAKAEQAEQYRQRYQEARYNSVYCTVALAKSQTNHKEKERLLKLAKQGVWSAFTVVDSQFGGGEWKAKNDRLLKDIQTALGEPAVGLRELETRKQQESAVSSAVK